MRRKPFARSLFFIFLLACLLTGLIGTMRVPVQAAPQMAPPPPHVLISEFRFLGPQGGNDEFIELYNATAFPVPIGGWLIRGSNNAGAVSTRATIPASINLLPGQYYLIAHTGYIGSVSADLTYGTGVTDDGGVALTLDNGTTIIDQVGSSSGSFYKEGTALSPLSGTANQSYERKIPGSAGNCNDTDNNSTDFVWNQSSSNPQNFTSIPLTCLLVTSVSSPLATGTYPVGTVIDITVTFNGIVDVTGTPTLLLETGVTNRPASYISGSGSNTLTFRYTIAAGDTFDDLDYVATDSLSLNGGTIIGAVGNATLVLPAPGSPGSLGANRDIATLNTDLPTTISFTRQNPTSAFTNAVSLTFRVTFSEAVNNVDGLDFVVTGTTATITSVTPISGRVHDVTITGVDLATLNGVVGLDFNPAQNIIDASGNPLPTTEPPIDETYTVDNVAPGVTINQAVDQADPANGVPVNFTVAFSEPIDVSTFTPADITQTGDARFITWNIIDSGDHRVFTLSAASIAQNGALIPSIAANQVTDLAGNPNSFSSSTDNTVVFTDNVPPTVTVNQAAGQADPTSALPVRFAVVFSEPINTAVFTISDITQNGTATGITWAITNSGDNRNFTLSATAITGAGTLVPSIPANRVTDMVGNNNTASTSTDNSITYTLPPPVIPRSIIINEIAWSGTKASDDDEWIELYNTTDNLIALTGWVLKSDDNTPTILLSGYTIPGKSYFLLARRTGTFRDVTPNLVYGDTGTAHTLTNSGEVLRLINGTGTQIDAANSYSGYGFTKWAAGSASPNYASMERKSFSLNSPAEWFTFAGTPTNRDRNNNLIYGTPGRANWALSVNATPSPVPTATLRGTATATPPPPPPPPLIAINEFVPRPGSDWNNDGVVNTGDEYIELLNHGVIDVNLSGYRLDDEANIGSPPFNLPSVTLKPGERVVFYGSETGLLLSDGGDGVRLLKPNGQLMDAYNYFVVDFPDQAFCRLPDNGGADDWNTNCYPTPGLRNSLSGSILRPPTLGDEDQPLCPIADTLPQAFVLAECTPFGNNIWNRYFWDKFGWYGEKSLPNVNGKWEVFAD